MVIIEIYNEIVILLKQLEEKMKRINNYIDV